MKASEIKQFYSFLKKHNAIETYAFNLTANHKDANFLTKIEPNGAIFCAFTWAATEQGHAYWAKLNVELHSFFKKYNI